MNKPVLEAIISGQECSFLVTQHKDEHFASFYHYHPHYELTLLSHGNGQLFVNNGIEYLKEGDIVLLGPYLAHSWKLEAPEGEEQKIHRITIQFSKDFLGEDFFDKPELIEIKKLLEKSKSGVVYKRMVAGDIPANIETMMNDTVNFKKLLTFLNILHKLSLCKDFTWLSYLGMLNTSCTIDQERISRINDFILENYKREVSLREVSDVACMTPNAFCRYFKKITKRKFVEVIVEYRIRYAVRQLLKTNKSVSQICFDCGFNDVVHFARVFKNKMHVSPLQYRKKISREFGDSLDSGIDEACISKTGAA